MVTADGDVTLTTAGGVYLYSITVTDGAALLPVRKPMSLTMPCPLTAKPTRR
jgi:hypothetical protein